MHYFVTLNGREFPLRLERAAGAAPRLWGAPEPGAPKVREHELDVELLRPARQGRPALVRVAGRLFRVLPEAAPGASARPLRADPARPPSSGPGRMRVNGQPLRVELETELARRVRPVTGTARVSGMRVAAPMPGRVVKVNVQVGDSVVSGTPLLSVEAMKMENELQSPGTGRVLSVHVQVGVTVESDQELVVIAPES